MESAGGADVTRVDFYLVADTAPRAAKVFACRLAEKAYRLGHRVYIAVDDRSAAEEMDGLLWTFSQSSFVPHCVAGDAGTRKADSPVLIGSGEPAEETGGVLLSLRSEIPGFHARFERVAEVVGADEDSRAAGRRRYRAWRDQGIDPVINHV